MSILEGYSKPPAALLIFLASFATLLLAFKADVLLPFDAIDML